jgi:PAS domain S-box-containing protein
MAGNQESRFAPTPGAGLHRTEQALRDSEERFRALVEGVRDYAIFALDRDGIVATWNLGAERIKGWPANEIVGQHFSTFYPEDAIARGWPQQELQQAQIEGRFEDEGWRLRKDGSRFWANVVITPLYDARGELQGYTKITRDLTERKKAEEQLLAAQADLEQRVLDRTAELDAANEALRAEIEERRRQQEDRERLADLLRDRIADLDESNRHRNEFLAMLGHELRNPLAPIRNALAILELPGAGETTRRHAQATIQRQVEHLVRLVDDLLDVSRIMKGKIELHPKRIELAEVVGRAIETAQPAIDARGHELSLSLPAEPVPLDGDIIRLSQVLSNLLVNAAKFTDRAGQIALVAEVIGDRVDLRVRDNGVGIAPELLPHIFDFFVQGSRSLERSQGGLGIGLTLVKRLVEMHGGTVRGESAGVGKGSEFVICLPLAKDAAAARLARAAATSAEPENRRRVLVVDDNVDAASSAIALLETWGHEAHAVFDGLSVLTAVRELRPEVVLLDIGLPGMNGYDVARELRQLPHSPVRLLAAMTGYGQDDDRRRALEAGFDVHLVKPLDPVRLRELVSSAPV